MASVPCEVCCRAPFEQLLPERTPRELEEEEEGWTYQKLCVVCVDQLLPLFPFGPHMLHHRELTGTLFRPSKTFLGNQRKQNTNHYGRGTVA